MRDVKIIQLVPSIQVEASGPSYSVPRLCDVLAGQGEEVELHVLSPVPEASFQSYAIHAYPAWPLLTRFGISPRMHRALVKAAKNAQIMHNHSLWMMPNIYPASVLKGTRCRLVTSPRGTLSEYALNRSRWLKKVVWAFGQGNVLRNSACLHATAEIEYREIRRRELRAPVAIIPNGIEMPPEQKQEKNSKQLRRLLFLGRIHPKKGVDVLLRAWARLERQHPDWDLHIVGPDNGGYLSHMRVLSEDLRVERVTFPGPVYGSEKSRAYWSADLFVLPTHSENFGLAVAEALAHGMPAIVSKGAPWSELETHGCGWWIDIGVNPLVECLREAMALSPEELTERGHRGRAWMELDFSWERIGEMMHKTYLWLLGGGKPPEWVVTD